MQKRKERNSTKALKHAQEHTLMEYLAVTISTCMICISLLISDSNFSEITSEKNLVVVEYQ